MAETEAAWREASEQRREVIGRMTEEQRVAPEQSTPSPSEPARDPDADATNQTIHIRRHGQ